MKKILLAVLVTLAFTASAGMGATSSQERRDLASSEEGKIASSLEDTYAYKNYLKDEDIKVREKDGVVTLTGTVSEDSKKSLAEETASALPGVTKVENKLEVKDENKRQEGGTFSDAWITTKAKAALAFQKGVSATDTKVEAKSGVVTLRGTAESDAQKRLATETVQDLEGVREVRNEMQVYGPMMGKTGPKDGTTDNLIGSGYPAMGTGSVDAQDQQIDDASVTASVKSALRMNRSATLPTEIKTENGVVTLKGEAKSAEEKDQISKRVSNIRGVKSVRNEMKIAGSGSSDARPDRTLTGQEGVSPYPAQPTGATPEGSTPHKGMEKGK